MASSITDRASAKRIARKQEGFSLLEVVISMAILSVGLVSLLGVFGLAMSSTLTTQQDLIAKQLANEALESIIVARNTTQLSWDDIQNVGSATCSSGSSCGIFQIGAIGIYLAPTSGANAGIVGTNNSGTLQTLQEPGPDGIYGTADDIQIPLTPYTRTITISQTTDATLRRIDVNVQYTTSQSGLQKSYVVSTFISQYR